MKSAIIFVVALALVPGLQSFSLPSLFLPSLPISAQPLPIVIPEEQGPSKEVKPAPVVRPEVPVEEAPVEISAECSALIYSTISNIINGLKDKDTPPTPEISVPIVPVPEPEGPSKEVQPLPVDRPEVEGPSKEVKPFPVDRPEPEGPSKEVQPLPVDRPEVEGPSKEVKPFPVDRPEPEGPSKEVKPFPVDRPEPEGPSKEVKPAPVVRPEVPVEEAPVEISAECSALIYTTVSNIVNGLKERN